MLKEYSCPEPEKEFADPLVTVISVDEKPVTDRVKLAAKGIGETFVCFPPDEVKVMNGSKVIISSLQTAPLNVA